MSINFEEKQQRAFCEIGPKSLKQLFDLKKIKQGQSFRLLKEWGGVQAIAKDIKTLVNTQTLNHTSGIDKDENQKRKRASHFGSNTIKVDKSEPLPKMIKKSFGSDPLISMLSYASLISLVLGMITEGVEQGWIEGASIFFGVVIIISVTSLTTYLRVQNHTVAEVNSNKYATVIRNGSEQVISIEDLLVGDVMKVHLGQMIPVDGVLLLKDQVVLVNQEYISDEKNIQVEKNKYSPFILSGSSVISLNTQLLMLVLAVGEYSFYHNLQIGEKRKTPLEIKLKNIMRIFRKLGIYSAISIFFIMTIRYVIDCLKHPNSWGAFFRFKTLDELVEYFIITIGILVISIPEGLPLAVTITLAYAMKMMKKQGVQVRHLYACQALGSTSKLIADKTGILTKNQMEVQKMFLFDKQIPITAKKDEIPKNSLDALRVVICASCTDLSNIANNTRKTRDRLSLAMIQMLQKLELQTKLQNEGFIKIFPFDSQKKVMTAIYEERKSPQDEYKTFICSKGMPKSLLALCSKFIDSQGNAVPMTDQYKNKILEQTQLLAKESIRVVLLAFQYCDQLFVQDDRQKYENNLISLGIMGINDPLKDNVTELLKDLQKASINVIMITGEPKDYAISIAKEMGILPAEWEQERNNDQFILDGSDFRRLVGGIRDKGKSTESLENIDKFKEIIKNLRIISKVTSEDKYFLISGLQQLQNTVATALTADNMQDLQILAKADVGITMQGNGIKQIQQFSDICLSDGSLKQMVSAIKWGRNILINIKKFIIYQLTINLVALAMAFIGGAINKESPLSSVQMLWVNIIINTLASLSFATEHPTNQLMQKRPFDKGESFITRSMWVHIGSQSILQITVLCIILFRFPEWMGIPNSVGFQGWNQDSGRHYAIFFNVFVYLQIFNQLNTRRYDSQSVNIFSHFLQNEYFGLLLGATFVMQLLLSGLGGEAVRTIDLSLQEHVLCIILGSMSLVSSLLIKTILPYRITLQIDEEPRKIKNSQFAFNFHND